MRSKHFKALTYIIFSIYCTINSVAQNSVIIKHIEPQYNNLPISIKEVSQDSIGNIWMSTDKGILKYNGHSYTLIKNEDIFSIKSSENRINGMYSDQNKNIWIKSNNGLLSKYDTTKGVFTYLDTLIEQPINSIKPVRKGLLIASVTGEVFTYFNNKIEKIFTIPNIHKKDNEIIDMALGNDTEFYLSTSKGKIFNYSLKTHMLNELTGPFIGYPVGVKLLADAKNRLWIGTETHGLFVYDILKKEFIQDTLLKGSIKNIGKDLFIHLYCDSNGFIWGGTDGGGLYIINGTTGQVNVLKYKYPNEFSLSSNTVGSISEDLNKNIWLVTKKGTINVITKPTENINYHKGSIHGVPLKILSTYRSSKGDLWIGTDGNGLVRIDHNQKEKDFFNDLDNNFYIQSITEDNNANIWLGTYRNGLWKYNYETQQFKNIAVSNSLNQLATDVRVVFTDSKNRIWVGSNVALNIFSSNNTLIASFKNNTNGLNGGNFESIIEDQNNQIWIGQLYGGLFKFNEDTNNIKNSSFTNYLKDLKNTTRPRVIDMCLGERNEIWFINEDFDLIQLNTKTKEFIDFKHLSPNQVYDFTAVIAQDEYSLWLSSSNGIHHFNVKTKDFISYYTSDGLQENNHIQRSKFIDDNGIIYFGSNKGLHYFNPDKLKKTPSKGNLFIRNIDILNKPAKDIIPNQITSDIFNLNSLHLTNNQSSFSVKFSAINNILNSNYHYSYKLIGFDTDWKSSYSEGIATYTNIPPGNYTLKFKANETNQSSGILEKEIKIIIAPPFWKTPIAYFIYLVLLSILIFAITKWFILNKKLLVYKISRKKEKELNNAKMTFFAKMSHEIQTPITLILSPIEDMLKRAEDNGNLLLKERLSVISNNAQRLSRIARELTLVRNKELKKLKLNVTQNNLYQNINDICLSFKELARVKKIDFNINCPKNLNDTWYDKEKIEHILYNVIDNAFKFTPTEGNIQLNVLPVNKKQFVKISVTDSGFGIPQNELKSIFKLFYRTNNQIKGTGIGLALTKELVDIHKGKIKVKSSKSEGTTFTFKIPVAEDAYLDNEKITSSKEVEKIEPLELESFNKTSVFDGNKKTILVVEDNFELQNFLKQLLSDQYNVLLSENGKQGYYHAKNNIPDLIVSDIMMPEMDGIELCEKLLENSLTKHIPVILLTAKNSTQTKITGLKAGAIEYINKPFNSNELLLKIKNTLIRKEYIISKYRKELINKPEIKIGQSQDEVFLENLNNIVNERLNDPNFKVDELSDKLNMSHSSLYRKCSTLTGLSLIDYIRQLRLKKAAILLVKYGYNISEVAYMVGFNNPKYFSKSFKSQFKITPKQFKNEVINEDDIEKYLKQNNIDIAYFNPS
ncbi:response regulator [Wocania ichthyoenteri]|uniref:response regulator n=1 Tax=Wocania ichthyoenteri TaxID=1230531 RepID=UPI00138DD716|nr:response regulator [Wocania ichthyoenteri]